MKVGWAGVAFNLLHSSHRGVAVLRGLGPGALTPAKILSAAIDHLGMKQQGGRCACTLTDMQKSTQDSKHFYNSAGRCMCC